ncbi:hypothetical protein BDB01DRAFT_816550 [Pilobolus umbonatus]|nr:hypothetical protein BDB01DRAFT_816550 [Pilobolus umbonatus]
MKGNKYRLLGTTFPGRMAYVYMMGALHTHNHFVDLNMLTLFVHLEFNVYIRSQIALL